MLRTFGKAVVVALCNEALLLLVLVLLLNRLPSLYHSALAPKLPSLGEALVQLIVCMPISATLFYGGHRLMHVPWVFEHVHYVHHAFHAPFALSSV